MRNWLQTIVLIIAVTAMAITALAQQARPFALLAVSWQPAFCEGRPDRPECATQTAGRHDADHFSLHGLWPQPRDNRYCGVPARLVDTDKAGRWGSLPDLQLSGELRSRLDQTMPGTRSFLHRHEWLKHGTCHEDGSVRGYFEDSLRLMDELNASPVRDLFATHIGKELTASQIRAAFDRAFGPGAGERVRVHCDDDGGRRLIDELTIGMAGVIDDRADLGALMAAARPTRPGCRAGVIDPVGLQ